MKTIRIKREVMEDISEFAEANHPREFIAYLSGNSTEEEILVDGLIYNPFSSSSSFATISADLPLISGMIGTVHSHPKGSALPSGQDLSLFQKTGGLHIIISYPYKLGLVNTFDGTGKQVDFEIL